MTRTPLRWREYAIESALIALFMLSAAAMTSLIEHPASAVRQAIDNPLLRRLLMGTAMGFTAASLIYSPWGRRSGAHFNPSVTLTFYRLNKITGRDAACYITAQFAGGVLGIAAAACALHPWITSPAVNYVATLPGDAGDALAFAAEAVISFLLMTVVLNVSNSARFTRFTGIAAALLVAMFITLEAPLSGMSMTPARTLGPDVVCRMARGLWLYFIAPPLGMLAAAEIYVRVRGLDAIHCAKLHHGAGPCIFKCGFGHLANRRG
jgi:aquaporin Z